LHPGPSSDCESDADPGEESDLNIEEEDDIPHPQTAADLKTWLDISSERLGAIHTSAGSSHRGNYHSSKIGKEPSKRSQQLSRKKERERREREKKEDARRKVKSTSITDFFGSSRRSVTASPALPETVELSDSSDSDSDESNGMEVDEVQAVDEETETDSPDFIIEDNTYDNPPPNAPSIHPAPETLPRTPPGSSTAPPNPPRPASVPNPVHFSNDNHGFIMPERAEHRKLPSPVPAKESVDAAIKNMQDLLHPRRAKGRGHSKTNLDLVTSARMESMIRFLRLYKAAGYQGWTVHSETVATASGKCGSKTWMARRIREWTIKFCDDKKNIPKHSHGRWNSSMLSDEDLAGDIHMHLQSLGKWVTAKDIARYVATPDFQARLRIKRQITVRTAQRWMKRMGYRWKREPKGMYSDGHERADVVHYRQNVFLPRWRELEARTRWWNSTHSDAHIEFDAQMRAFHSSALDSRVVVIWRHDESTFYAHDRRDLRWVHKSETAKIKAKGEGASLMVGDFMSPEYGFMKSKHQDPTTGEFKTARNILKPGKKRDGYQTTQDIIDQSTRAMDILDEDYANKKHALAYDNATIHTARAPDALSASKMTSKPSENFNKVKRDDGTTYLVRMRDAVFRDGSAQSLYLPNGQFKGMKTIIQERRAKGHDLPDPDSIDPCTRKK
ncbi:hypothetical protein R3P38DRAFT_2457219, partial [Favolaschia claudopus]